MKFKKKDRLLTQSDFTNVFDSAHKRAGRRGTILRSEPYLIYRAPHLDEARLGLSIARRVIKNATDRNRIKRCIKEFFRAHKEVIEGDIIVRLSHRPKNFTYESLTTPLQVLLNNSRS
ncbi:MAG: ribonuclease P protein component [Deltaproteobacteria bacterium]|nr:ribonuclease P protein component [Deltaproteobacteria bacterium]